MSFDDKSLTKLLRKFEKTLVKSSRRSSNPARVQDQISTQVFVQYAKSKNE